MKQKIWAKTLLSSYNCLENISSAIDNLVVTQGISSSRNNLTTIENAEKIINLIQRKKLLINLKVLIENTIANISSDNARLLVLKFFDRLKTEVCLEVCSMSRRTFFRKVDKAIEEFSLKLKHLGYDDACLTKMFAKEHWIKEIFNNLSKQKDEFTQEEQPSIIPSLELRKITA